MVIYGRAETTTPLWGPSPLYSSSPRRRRGVSSNESSSTQCGTDPALCSCAYQSRLRKLRGANNAMPRHWTFFNIPSWRAAQAPRSFSRVIIHRVWGGVTEIILQGKKKQHSAKLQKCPFAEYLFKGKEFYIMTYYCKSPFCFMYVHKWLYFREIQRWSLIFL